MIIYNFCFKTVTSTATARMSPNTIKMTAALTVFVSNDKMPTIHEIIKTRR